MRVTSSTHFYPRSPCGERHVWAYPDGFACLFLSTLSLRRATGCAQYYIHAPGISIHALLAESDLGGFGVGSWPRVIFLSTLSLRRATSTTIITICIVLKFLSTLSLRRATTKHAQATSTPQISIHALLAESDGVTVLGIQHRSGISIHALLAESDLDRWLAGLKGTLFLSTLSLRRATILVNTFSKIFEFLSTLSLRRATIKPVLCKIDTRDFYPRSPCGERRSGSQHPAGTTNFYPRSPCGERRVTVLGIQHKFGISIHALLAESDLDCAAVGY